MKKRWEQKREEQEGVKAAKKEKDWEDLEEFLVGAGAEMFMEAMKDFFDDPDPRMRAHGASLYKDIIEYVKPKLARTDSRSQMDFNFNVIDSYEDGEEIDSYESKEIIDGEEGD